MCLKSQQNELYLRQQGTGQPHIYRSHVESFPIPEMSLEQQKEMLEKYKETETKLIEAQKLVEVATSKMSNIIQSVYQ